MDILYNLFGILSFLMMKKINTYAFENCSSTPKQIGCNAPSDISSYIISAIKAYSVDNCTRPRYSNLTQLNISTNQFSSCIGVNNCTFYYENNNGGKMILILYNCSKINSIISLNERDLKLPNSPIFYSASLYRSSSPLLSNNASAFHCYFKNTQSEKLLSIDLSIVVLNFLPVNECDQQLIIFKSNSEVIYASCGIYKPDFKTTISLTNDSFVIQYTNRNVSSGKLLVLLEWLGNDMLSIRCEEYQIFHNLLISESILTSSTIVLPFNSSTSTTSNIVSTNFDRGQHLLSPDAIAGIVVGTTLFLLLIILLACLILYLKEKKLKKKTENIAINPVTSAAAAAAADAADASIGTGETEYKYEPSLAHLEGSDLSGSFQFEKKVMALATEELPGKSKKDKPVLISNYINNDKYSAMQLNDETNRIYTPLSSVTDITNINDTDRGRIESIIMTLENSIYDKNDNSFNFVTSSDIITVEENSLYSETKNDCDKNNNPDLDVSLQPIVTKNKVNINTIDKFNFVTSSDNLTVEENSLYSEIKNDCDITNKPDLNLSLQPIVKNNNININTMDNFIGSSEDLQLEENAIYNKIPDKIPTNDNIIYYELENEVTDLGETNLQQIIPIYEEVEIN